MPSPTVIVGSTISIQGTNIPVAVIITLLLKTSSPSPPALVMVIAEGPATACIRTLSVALTTALIVGVSTKVIVLPVLIVSVVVPSVMLNE